MKMTFVRSGGFAGPMMRVEGTVDFEGDQATVTSARKNYRRELDAAESQMLKKAASEKIAGGSKAMPDSFQYDVVVTQADGKTERETVQGDSSSPLIEWIKKESERIFSQKL